MHALAKPEKGLFPLGFCQNLNWKLGQQTPSAGTLLAYISTQSDNG